MQPAKAFATHKHAGFTVVAGDELQHFVHGKQGYLIRHISACSIAGEPSFTAILDKLC